MFIGFRRTRQIFIAVVTRLLSGSVQLISRTRPVHQLEYFIYISQFICLTHFVALNASIKLASASYGCEVNQLPAKQLFKVDCDLWPLLLEILINRPVHNWLFAFCTIYFHNMLRLCYPPPSPRHWSKSRLRLFTRSTKRYCATTHQLYSLLSFVAFVGFNQFRSRTFYLCLAAVMHQLNIHFIICSLVIRGRVINERGADHLCHKNLIRNDTNSFLHRCAAELLSILMQ